MNFEVRKEEAKFLLDLVMHECQLYEKDCLVTFYGEIDIDSMIRQLENIMQFGDSIEEEKVF